MWVCVQIALKMVHLVCLTNLDLSVIFPVSRYDLRHTRLLPRYLAIRAANLLYAGMLI